MISIKNKILKEIDVYKWIESEKNKKDLGQKAIDDWLRIYYNDYLRKNWIYHITGKEKIEEFDEKLYNICNKEPLKNNKKLEFVLKKLLDGGENLSILVEDIECLNILLILNINDWRISFDKIIR